MRTYLPLLLAAALGCNDPGPGRSVGRPPAQPVDRPEPSALRIAEIYVADADANDHFVELVVDEAETVELADAELCGPVACIPAKDCTDTTVQLGDRVLCDLGELKPPLAAGAGELAVVIGDTVLAYLAWGADPAVFGAPWSAAAVLSGATEAGAFVDLPFPMPLGVAVGTLADGTQGCALPSPGDISDIDPALCPATTPSIFITEILAPLGDTGASWVELENSGTSAVRLAGARLCQLPSCIVFGYEDTIGALGRLLVHLGRAGGSADSAQVYFPDATPVRAGGELILLGPGGGDISAEPESMLSFVRYGSLTGGVAAAAVQAGLWPEIFDSARAPRIAGESLSRDLSGELRGSAWNPAEPTPVAPNPDISEATDLWQSCSFPRPWRDPEPSPIVVRRVTREAPATVVIENRGTTAVDLLSYELAVAAATRRVSDAIVPAASTGVDDEAIARIADTNVDVEDFVRSTPTIEGASLDCEGIVISELVVDPVQDWNDSAGPFDATPGTGLVDGADQWIEIANCGPAAVDLTGYTLELVDGSSNQIELGVTNDGQVLIGALLLEVNSTLIVGNPDPASGLGDTLEVTLSDASGALVDRVRIGQELGPGETTTLELRVDASDCDPLNVCWRGAPQVLNNGEMTLLDAGLVAQHIRWGNAVRVYTDDAVAAGVWPLSECALPELAEGEGFELARLETGHSPPDYR